MHKLDQDTLLAIGRMTVAATDVEHVLAWLATDRTVVGTSSARPGEPAFAQPGEALGAARDWAASAPADVRSEYAGLIEGAATQLARGQAALRSLWRDDGPATSAAKFDEIAMFLTRARDALTDLAAGTPTP